jgi:signal peptidase I
MKRLVLPSLVIMVAAICGYYVGGHSVKRIVGRPGDRIEIRDGVVWINGHPGGVKGN